MKKTDLVLYMGGTKQAAKACGVSRQRFHVWKQIPEDRYSEARKAILGREKEMKKIKQRLLK